MRDWAPLWPKCRECLFLRSEGTHEWCLYWREEELHRVPQGLVITRTDASSFACGAFVHADTLETLIEYLRRLRGESAEGTPYRGKRR